MSTLLKSIAFAVAIALVVAAANAAVKVQPGDQSRWSLDFSVRLEQHAAPPVEMHLLSDWVSTVTAVRAGEYEVQLQLDRVSFTGDSAKTASPASLENLKQRLSRPFWATYRVDGGLLAVHFFRDVTPSDQNLLQMIATELQLVRPESEQSSWTAQERDGAGEYLALYVMPEPDRIMKRKVKYIYTDGVAGAVPDAMRVAIDQSSVTFSLAPDGSIQTADGNSRVNMELSADGSGQLAAVTEIHLGNLRIARAPELIGSLALALPNVTSSPIVTHRPDPAEVQKEADDRMLAGRTTESLLDAAFTKGGDDATLSDRLVALFRQRPESTSAAVQFLSKNGAKKRVTDALGMAGSPAAVAALSTLAHDDALAEPLRVDAVIAFVQMQHPTAEAMRVPADLLNDSNCVVQSAARMIGGALARAGRQEHPEEADAMDAALIGLYRSAHETQPMIDLLGALGNSAGPSVIPVIEEGLKSARVPVRAAAARALRLAPGADVDRLIASVIASDSDPAVRADAIFASKFRRPLPGVLADAILHAAIVDSVDYVRSDAVAVLRQNPTASPNIPDTLARVASRDASAGIRREASEALASIYPAAQKIAANSTH